MVASVNSRILNSALEKGRNILYAMGFFFEVLKQSVLFFYKRKAAFKVLIMQILFTGIEALGVIGLLSLSIGAAIIVQGMDILSSLGQPKLIYTILIAIITRELGPILTAFIITARSGTAMATELGNSVISHEIEAYVACGVNPISYLIAPRFLGVVGSMVLLNIYFNLFGLLGSYGVSLFIKPIPFFEYTYNLLTTVKFADVVVSLGKSVVFGAIISTVASYYGLKVERASTEIPQMTIKAVGLGFMLCIVADVLITLVYYLGGLAG